ncbi:hypothetical protein QCC96_003808 [Enterobacter hormaechei]|nr:hypothetical protein [Enterobacter hormaechei]
MPTRQPGEKRRMQGRHRSRSAVKKQEQAGQTEPENDGKTADNAFEINCDRVKVTAFTLPLHQPRPGYSRGTAFAAGRTGRYSTRSRNNVEEEP